MAELTLEDLLNQANEYLSKPISAPKYTGVSNAPVKKELAALSKARDETVTSVDTEKTNYADANKRANNATIESGDAAAQYKLEEQARAQDIADIATNVNQMLGISENTDAYVGILADRNRQLSPAIREEIAVVKKMQSVGPLDNPLEWLLNGIQLPSKIQNLNASIQEYNTNEVAISDSLKNSKEITEAKQRGVPSITVGMAKSNADKIKADARKAAADADILMTKFNLDADSKKLAAQVALSNATLQSTAQDIQQAEQKYRAAMDAVRIQADQPNRLLQAAKNIEILQDLKFEKAVINRAANILGYEEGILTHASMAMMAKTNKQKYDTIMAIGQSGSLAATPLDVLKTLKLIQVGPGFSEDSSKIVGYLNKQLTTVRATSEAGKPGEKFKELPKEQQEAIISTKLNEAILGDISNAASSDTNFFHELSPAKMMLDPKFKASALGKIVEPLATTGQEVMPSTIVSTFMAALKNNPSNAGVAIADYYKENIRMRNTNIPFKNVGSIDVPISYLVKIGGASFDLTDPVQATRYAVVTQMLAGAKKSFNPVASAFPGWLERGIVREEQILNGPK